MAYRVLNLQPDPALLNPRFDGYKLRAAGDGAVSAHPLQSAPVRPQLLAANALLTYDEVSSRIHYNHLFVGPRRGTFVYFSEDRQLHMAEIRAGEPPRFTRMFAVPTRPSTGALQGYPGAYSLSETLVLAFDGAESLYILQRRDADGEAWVATGTFEIGAGPAAAGPPAGEQRPTMNHVLGATLAHVAGEPAIRLHVCSRAGRSGREGAAGRSAPAFCIQALQVAVPAVPAASAGDVCPALVATTAHTLRSHAIPTYCEHVDQDTYILGVRGGVALDDTELVLQPGDAAAAAAATAALARGSDPYRWSQTAAEVTMHITLPRPLDSSLVRCELAETTLTLQFPGEGAGLAGRAYERERLQDLIVPGESGWALEGGVALTVRLKKQHPGARWASLFHEDDGVLETMEAGELAAIGARLEKYTAAVQDAGRAAAPLMHPYVDQDCGGDPDQAEEDADASVMFSVRSWHSGLAEATSAPGSPGWLCPAFSPPPALRAGAPPVCLKTDVDGAVFGFGEPAEGGGVGARHLGTLSALAYVQASKREKRLFAVDPAMAAAVLAEAQRRIYVYHQAPRPDAPAAAQSLVDLGGAGEYAEILGMQLAGRALAVLRPQALCVVDLDLC
ncbi:hypothetical protein H4R18_002384 [Coemansia javaensis]|uniref:NudC domain-containing protein 1 n=1 Tax=Coemansia javaensis TaxID=2761396 RepID=A0A9W8HEQ8_9FUNG|nr:hypothetical protein H4R18_002384 [Coemansia javaensis]